MEYTVIINYDLEELKRELIQKAQNFSDFHKDYSGYYFIYGVIEKAKYWNFRNERTFFTNLSWVIQEFPVKNNNKVYFGDYFYVLDDFKTYIRKEFGVVPRNYIFWKRFWLVFLLTFLFSFLLTPMIGIPLCIVLSLLMARLEEKRVRKQGRVI